MVATKLVPMPVILVDVMHGHENWYTKEEIEKAEKEYRKKVEQALKIQKWGNKNVNRN